ncbi:MAG: glycosyltransferase family 39 protein [Betaproteobacteria bacterium]
MKRFFSSLGDRLIAFDSTPVFLSLCFAWLCFTAGFRPLTLPDEGRYIGVAWEMLSSGNWLDPTLDGMPFFHKPPLFYWITAAGLKLFGSIEWAGRLASLLAGLVMIVSLHAFVRQHRDKRTANLAIAILVTMPFFFVGAQFANLDMLVAGMISATIISGANAILALQKGLPHRRALAFAYIFAALGILAKGLIGIVLPGAILFGWLIVTQRFRLIPRLFPIYLIVLFIAVVAPWFWLMEKAHPGFLHYFFVYHHFQRFSETGFNNQRAVWFYLPVLLALALPWSIWIWRVFKRNVLFDREGFAIRSLMILWLLGILVFFSLPNSKLVGYILPTLPPLAFLIAEALLAWQQERSHSFSSRPALAIGATLAFAATFCVAIIPAATHLDSASFKPASAIVLPQFQAADQIVMLEDYQYDMAFYLKASKPAWVINTWDDPEIPKFDDGRKELFDAGQFDPAARQKFLIHASQFAARLCQETEGTLWVWGRTDRAQRFAFLEKNNTVFADARMTLWKLDAASRKALTICR